MKNKPLQLLIAILLAGGAYLSSGHFAFAGYTPCTGNINAPILNATTSYSGTQLLGGFPLYAIATGTGGFIECFKSHASSTDEYENTGNAGSYNYPITISPPVYYGYGDYEIDWNQNDFTNTNNDTLTYQSFFTTDEGNFQNSLPSGSTNLSTHIISLSPAEGTTTENPVTFTLDAYISPNDIGAYSGVEITLHNIDQNVLLRSASDENDIFFLNSIPSEGAGEFYFSSTTVIADGNYRIEAKLVPNFLVFTSPFNTLAKVDHQFIVGSPTFIGNISQTSYSAIQAILGSSDATTTTALAQSCNPFSGDAAHLFFNTGFSVTSCLAFLFIPDAGYVDDTIQNLKDNVSTHFPVGYFTSIYSILSTTTAASLTVIDTDIPSILPGHGSHIHLDANHILDTLLNATSGPYWSAQASSTQNFYQITSYYWDIVVEIATGLYIVGRIAGTHFGFSPESFGAIDLGPDIDRAEREDNRHIARQIFKRKIKNKK